MLEQGQINAANRRFQAASSELGDPALSANATLRMSYLWAWAVELGHELDLDDLHEAIWSFQIEYQAQRGRRLGASVTRRPGSRGMTGPVDAATVPPARSLKKKRSKAKTKRKAAPVGRFPMVPRPAIAVAVALVVGVGIGRALSLRA